MDDNVDKRKELSVSDDTDKTVKYNTRVHEHLKENRNHTLHTNDYFPVTKRFVRLTS